MRVALLTNFVAPYRVPLFRSLGREVTELVVCVSSLMERNRSWEVQHGDGFRIEKSRTVSLRLKRRGATGFVDHYELHLPIGTFRQLVRLEPDVVISGELGIRTLLAMAYCQTYCKPLVVWATLSEHTEANRGRARLAIRRRLLRRANAVMVNGKSGARYVQGLGVPPHAVSVTGQASHLDLASAEGVGSSELLQRRLRLLYVGSLVEGKGLVEFARLWFEASAAVPEREFSLVVAGMGPDLTAVLSLRRPLNVRVEAVGHIEGRALTREYLAADAVVLPTLADEWGLVINEAMMAGTPVLGSVYSQAANELLIDGVTGWLFDPLDEEGTASILWEIVRMPAGAFAVMGAAARDAVKRCDVEAVAGRMRAVIDRVSGAEGRGADGAA